jgi:Protein of unknown function (DUF2442)
MSTSRPRPIPRAVGVSVTDEELTVELSDGRRLTTPLAWFPRLARAKPDQRRIWRFIGEGIGIHWPEIDEDLSVEGLLRGEAAPGSKRAV